MKTRSDESFVAAYKEIYKYLGDRGCKPTLNVADNEYSKAVKNTLTPKELLGNSSKLTTTVSMQLNAPSKRLKITSSLAYALLTKSSHSNCGAIY